jgi:hypothetical protein
MSIGSWQTVAVVALRSRRLETLFGADLDAITAENIRGLVETQAQEAFDLDFKEKPYGGGDSEKRKLAGDVAALANTAGGVIVIGISEDEQARAIAAPGVDVTDAERSRISQVAASLLSPLPLFDVLTVLDRGQNGTSSGVADADQNEVPSARGIILIAVPRSSNAPHAVLVNDALWYPKRNGATTRYLSEPEVAAAYQDRAAGAARQAGRISQIELEAFDRLDRTKQSWVVVALVPDLPGDFPITTGTFDEFQRTTQDTDTSILGRFGVTFQRIGVGRRRLLADGTMNQSSLASYLSVEVHSDGAGTYGLWLYDMTQSPRDPIMSVPQIGTESVEIGQARRYGFPESRSRTSVRAAVAAEAVAALDNLASPGTPLIATAATLVDEIGQAFGIPELGQLSRDGTIRWRYWSSTWQQGLVRWAEQNEIRVTDDLLRG